MPRIKLELPEHFHFKTEIHVRESDLNHGGFLGNDALFSLMNEARIQFYNSLGYSEENVDGAGTVMSDAVIVFKSESSAGDGLTFELAAGDFTRIGCDLYYRITNAATGVEVARAKTAIGFLDYRERKMLPVPKPFRALFEDPAGR